MRILITGDTSGIGFALKDLFIKKNYEVYGMSRTNDKDVAEIDNWAKLYEDKEKFDIIILNAGIAFFAPEIEFSHRNELINTNLLGVYYGLYYAPKLLNDRGTVIVISSISAFKPEPELPLYASTKAAISSMVSSFGLLYANKYRVIGICPGFVRTNLGDQKGEPPEQLVDRVPMKRIMEPEELAIYIDKIIDINYMTCTNIIIDGGYRWI